MNTLINIDQLLDKISVKYKLDKQEIKQCLPMSVKKRILYKKIIKEKINIEDKFIIENCIVIGKKENGVDVNLTLEDIEECKFNNLKYQLPNNLSSGLYDYSKEIRNYISDSELDED